MYRASAVLEKLPHFRDNFLKKTLKKCITTSYFIGFYATKNLGVRIFGAYTKHFLIIQHRDHLF